jgi:hypothetical protein
LAELSVSFWRNLSEANVVCHSFGSILVAKIGVILDSKEGIARFCQPHPSLKSFSTHYESYFLPSNRPPFFVG